MLDTDTAGTQTLRSKSKLLLDQRLCFDCASAWYLQAEATIEAEVTRRLELCGADFARWPRAAREETARLEKKLDAAQRLTATLHAELDASARQRQSEAVARAQLQVWFLAGCLFNFACRFMNLSRGHVRCQQV